ncbi:MAG TPA: oxidoreductase, partial [Polyangiales bacterium]
MQLVGASAAVSFASGCAPDVPEKILPYVRRPVDVTPGKSTHYATSLAIDGFATGLIVETREGRPIKVEGNPAHPCSLGATSIYHQASVLQLYDPDRARGVSRRGQPATWAAIETMLRAERSDRGAGLRLLLEPSGSPLIAAQLGAIKQRFPACKITFYSPLPSQASSDASQLAFGERLAPQYDLTSARVIVALDSDLLACPYQLRYAREFGAARHVADPQREMNRLYALESAMSITGSMADHRLRRPSGKIAQLTAALANAVMGESLARASVEAIDARLDGEEKRFIAELARDLRARAPGETLVVVGERQPSEVHALGYAINARLGNLGRSLRFTPQAVPDRAGDQELAALAREMQAGAVDTLVMFGANPSYDAPPQFAWSQACRRCAHTIYCGMYDNETAADAEWFAPLLHPFESWSDGRAYDGTLSFAQPLIKPLFGGKSVSELLGMLGGEPNAGDHARLRVRFGAGSGEGLTLAMSASERSSRALPQVQAAWERTLAQGFVADSAFAAVSPILREAAAITAFEAIASSPPSAAGIELNFLRSPTLHDGRYANVSWLLELPDSITKLTWDNALLMSPTTAARLGLPEATPDDDDRYPVIELSHAGRSLRAPLLCLPSHADDS